MKKQVLIGLLISLQVVGISFGQNYQVTDLGSVRARGINDSGQIVGTGYPTYFGQDAFVYSNGSIRDLGNLSGSGNGGGSSEAQGINASGQIVGRTDFGAMAGHAFLYSGGTMHDLGTLGGSGSHAYGINTSGQVVGYSQAGYLNYPHAFSYRDGAMTDLGTLGGSSSFAYGINDIGQIVGCYYTSQNICRSFLYSGGSMQDIGAGTAFGINEAGQVVGNNGAGHAFLYSAGITLDLGVGQANAVNSSGLVVGRCGGDSAGHASLYSNGSLMDLNNLISPTSGWILQEATAINDSGAIVGYGINAVGLQNAFLLTPIEVPEPASLIPVGLITLALWRKVRKPR